LARRPADRDRPDYTGMGVAVVPPSRQKGNAEMSDTPRLCKDCRFADPTFLCEHPTSRIEPEVDLVTGEMTAARSMYCSAIRQFGFTERCGPAGRYWEPRGFG
jgi:hypothetical protein